MLDSLAKILSELKLNLARTLGDNLYLVTLYGSYARDEAIEGSDVDLLVVLKESTAEDEALVRKIVYDTMWQVDFAYYLALFLIDEPHYRTLKQRGASIFKNIQNEGQVLWSAT
ncbi:nucleotidyltransferase domain-containing protein [Chloroflexota bacterium]